MRVAGMHARGKHARGRRARERRCVPTVCSHGVCSHRGGRLCRRARGSLPRRPRAARPPPRRRSSWRARGRASTRRAWRRARTAPSAPCAPRLMMHMARAHEHEHTLKVRGRCVGMADVDACRRGSARRRPICQALCKCCWLFGVLLTLPDEHELRARSERGARQHAEGDVARAEVYLHGQRAEVRPGQPAHRLLAGGGCVMRSTAR